MKEMNKLIDERLERITLENLVKEKELENWRRGQKGFISGIIGVTSIVGVLIGFLLIQMFFDT